MVMTSNRLPEETELLIPREVTVTLIVYSHNLRKATGKSMDKHKPLISTRIKNYIKHITSYTINNLPTQYKILYFVLQPYYYYDILISIML